MTCRRPPNRSPIIDDHTAPEVPDAVPGTWNFRDIASVGGLQTGVLFRSASLQYLGQDGHRALQELGIGRVIDLRGPQEIARDGAYRLGDGIEQVHIAFDGYVDLPTEYNKPGESDNQRLTSLLADVDAQTKLRAFFNATYVAMVRSPVAAAAIRDTLTSVTESDEPVLFHCQAGKDRTGWLSAVVLMLADIPMEQVMADFLSSNRYTERLLRSLALPEGTDLGAAANLFEVREQYLVSAIAAVEETYATVPAYLDAIGFGPHLQARLRAKLVCS